MGQDMTCCECGYWRGSPNTKIKGEWVFVCSHCKSGYDSSDEIKESKHFDTEKGGYL